MSETEQWADDVEQVAEMPAIKLFGRWTTDDVQVSFVWTDSIRAVWTQSDLTTISGE